MKKAFIELVVITSLLFGVSACDSQKNQKAYTRQDSSSIKMPDGKNQSLISDSVIVGGSRVGNIRIGGNAEILKTILGQPDVTNGAMGSGTMTWYTNRNSSGDKITVFISNKGVSADSVSRIRKILVTSPHFKMADGLSTGLTLTTYQKYIDLSPVNHYVDRGRKINIYQAPGKGLTFEIDQATNKGTAIIIHNVQDTVYTNLN